MTFIWPRLTWPALVWRHAGPWSRKISATSNAGRHMAAGCYAGGETFSPMSGFLPGFLRGCDSRSSGLLMLEIMPVATRVQRYALLDPGPIGRLVEQPVELAGGHRHAVFASRKQPAFLKGCCVGIETSTRLPPLPQQINHRRRQHDIAILAALGLLDTNDLLRAVDMLDLQPDHFAGTQAAPIAKTECHAGLEARGNGQHATRLVRTHHLRNLLRLADVINLGRELQPPQCHPQQEPHPGHDTVAIADARARLGKMQLKPADVLRGRRVR